MDKFDKNRTLEEVITSEVRWNKPGKKGQREDAEAVCSFLQDYYGGKTKEEGLKRSRVLDWRINEIIENQDRFVMDLQEGVRSYSRDKYTLVCRLEVLIQHLSKKYGLSCRNDLFDNFKYREKSERLLKLLKYLHAGEHSREEIASQFGISTRTLDGDLNELQDGYEFLDTRMQIEKLVHKKNTYNSVIHPVFLALRTDEMYSLTVGLKLLSKGTVYEQSMGHIADLVHQQLSSYAKQVVDIQADQEGVSFDPEELEFISTAKLMEQYNRAFAYFLKEPIECVVSYREKGDKGDKGEKGEKGEMEQIKGTMHLPEYLSEESARSFNRVVIRSDEGSKELDINDVVRIGRTTPYQDYTPRR